MARRLSRREFVKKTALAAGAAVGAHLSGAPCILGGPSPGSRLGTAVVGAGGRGMAHLGVAAGERLVALVDVDDNRMAGAIKALEKSPGFDVSKVKTYFDYRKMFDEMHKDIDVVFVATPENHHACASMAAIKLGKHVYCEKPLTHDVYEARALGEAARQYKVMTQMGDQGHAGEGIRALREYLDAGAIGTVLETHSWQTQVYGPRTRGPTKPVPPGLHWDEWIGPAPYRDYHDSLHPSPGWYQWMDFGTGLLGGLAPHVMDPVHWCLQLKYPASCAALEQEGCTPDVWPTLNTLLYEFPRPDLPPLKAYWYDGVRENKDPDVKGKAGNMVTTILNRPRLADELEKKHGREFTGGGTLFVGDKGVMVCGVYGDGPRIIPEEKHKEFPMPAKKYPRTRDIHTDFLRACKEGGQPPCSNLPDVAGPFQEAMLVGNLAMRAGVGRKVEWDGPNMKCTNLAELNQYVKREYRKGWTL